MFTSIRNAFRRVEAALNRFAECWERWSDECEARLAHVDQPALEKPARQKVVSNGSK